MQSSIPIKYERKLKRAKILINQIKNGTDPINNAPINKDSFLKDTKMQHLFAFIDEVLDNEIYSLMPKVDFYINSEEIDSLEYPDNKDNLTITEFTEVVNTSIRLLNRKRLSPTQMNKKLRELKEIKYEVVNDKKINRATELGKEHGVLEKISTYNDVDRYYVCYGKTGFSYLKGILREYFSDNEF